MKLPLSAEHHTTVNELWTQAQRTTIQHVDNSDAIGNANPFAFPSCHRDSLIKDSTSSPSLLPARHMEQRLYPSATSRANDACIELVGEDIWSDHGDTDDTDDEYVGEEDHVGSSEDEQYQPDVSNTETSVNDFLITSAAASPDTVWRALQSSLRFSVQKASTGSE